ncbi:MAG: hypothetical protein HQL21_08170, partial [Candidatus Omnitrophica bacterium]|nr:hypothetical protein [Candidatus Omnitrophota bacterium]
MNFLKVVDKLRASMNRQFLPRILMRAVSCVILAAFVSTTVIPPSFAQVAPWMPQPGTLVALSPVFIPAQLKGMVIDPNAPFKFDFIVDKGDESLSDIRKQDEYQKLIRYFLAALAVPDKEQWVNLSPYEQNRIIPDSFGLTSMGRDLLAQDYLLKQIASSLSNPDERLGQTFWSKVYAAAQEKFGTTDIPASTINKVWIVPDKADMYEKDNAVIIVDSHLKVMLEEDYLAIQQNAIVEPSSVPQADEMGKVASRIMREIIIPVIEKEVNEGKNFAPLRQVVSGMILATWYKMRLKETILGKVYADKAKVRGIDQDPRINQEIYSQYLDAFKKGVFNMIKEDVDQFSQELIPRKYFSGGFDRKELAMAIKIQSALTPAVAGRLARWLRDKWERVQGRLEKPAQPSVVSTMAEVADSFDSAQAARNAGRFLSESREDDRGNWEGYLPVYFDPANLTEEAIGQIITEKLTIVVQSANTSYKTEFEKDPLTEKQVQRVFARFSRIKALVEQAQRKIKDIQDGERLLKTPVDLNKKIFVKIYISVSSGRDTPVEFAMSTPSKVKVLAIGLGLAGLIGGLFGNWHKPWAVDPDKG